jgi:hypothetical protein
VNRGRLKQTGAAPVHWLRDYYQNGPARRAQIRSEERLADQARRVGYEQILYAMTPLHKRNPVSAYRAIERDGYAVYDGPPHPAGDGLAGSPERGTVI